MPTANKQVHIFIFSTFRYMHTERDHLVTVVFPELRERIEQSGLEFFDVDFLGPAPIGSTRQSGSVTIAASPP